MNPIENEKWNTKTRDASEQSYLLTSQPKHSATKTRPKNPESRFTILHYSCWIVFSAFLAQSAAAVLPFGLKMELKEGQVQLVVTGAPGTVCQIQSTDNLSTTNGWFHVGHCVLAGTASRLTDSTGLCGVRRFYRGIWSPSTNLVWISPGTFTMGSPVNETLRGSDESQHDVTISHGYWMGKYLVTQNDYISVTGCNPSYFTPADGYSNDVSRPIEGVSWFDAVKYCALLTQRELIAGHIPSNYVYRLPTESEWEYACRAGTRTATYLGKGMHSGDANFDGQMEYDTDLGETNNPNGIFTGHTVPVGSYRANSWGLYDMNGNLWEWCQDWYSEYPTNPVTDPHGPTSGLFRVWRGGSWGANARFCRSSQRLYFYPEFRCYSIGFRVVLSSKD